MAEAVRSYGVVLAAHGPYTAAGAAMVTGLPVPVVSRSFCSFDGLVAALEEHFAAKSAVSATAGAAHSATDGGSSSARVGGDVLRAAAAAAVQYQVVHNKGTAWTVP